MERICTLFREQGITIISVLTAFSLTITKIALALTSVFGGGPSASGSSSPKDNGILKK